MENIAQKVQAQEDVKMDLKSLYEIKDETEQIAKTYEIFQEDTRLNRSKAAQVEFFTNVKYIEKYLKPGDRILDIGAGTGAYMGVK